MEQKDENNKSFFYITFGDGQVFYPGNFKVYAEDEMAAREKIFRVIGNKWAFCYEPDRFAKVPWTDQITHKVIDDDKSIQDALHSYVEKLCEKLCETLTWFCPYEQAEEMCRLHEEIGNAIQRLQAVNNLLGKGVR